ncbi:hypothetical protein [Roseomonas sp. WA12]
MDAGLAARVSRVAEALATARGEGERLIEVVLRGQGAREVSLTSVLPTPAGKPSWRLVVLSSGRSDGRAQLQGWAVVESLARADWDGVRLTLVSGESASLHQGLYEAIRLPRQELPVRVAEVVRVEADIGSHPSPPLAPAAAPTMRSRAYEASPPGSAPIAQA